MKDLLADRLGRVVLAFAWFDLGLLVVLLPWSPFWEGNALLARHPWLIPIALSGYVRGAISGIGLLDILLAAEVLTGRRRSPAVVSPH
jgi:hypothetical protein